MTEHERSSAAVDPRMVDGRNGKPRRVSRRVAEAVRLITSGEVTTIKASAVRVGLHPNYLSGYLAGPVGRAFLARERAKTIQNASLRAARRLEELIDADSEHVSLDASRLTLGLEGVVVEERRHVDIGGALQVGYVIDLSPPTAEEVAERARLINPLPTIAAEAYHELSGPAKAAIDHVPAPNSATGFTPDARWSSAVPRPPEPERPRQPDAFDQAAAEQQARVEADRARRGR